VKEEIYEAGIGLSCCCWSLLPLSLCSNKCKYFSVSNY